MPKLYLRIDLLEPLPESAGLAPDSLPAVEEFRDYLLNEFDNQGISAVIAIVDGETHANL